MEREADRRVRRPGGRTRTARRFGLRWLSVAAVLALLGCWTDKATVVDKRYYDAPPGAAARPQIPDGIVVSDTGHRIPPRLSGLAEEDGAGADSVRYGGGLYFRLHVPERLLAGSRLIPKAVPCEVKSGPAFQVYFMSAEVRRPGIVPGARWTAEDLEARKRWRVSVMEASMEIKELTRELVECKKTLGKEGLTEADRAGINEKVERIETQIEERRERREASLKALRGIGPSGGWTAEDLRAHRRWSQSGKKASRQIDKLTKKLATCKKALGKAGLTEADRAASNEEVEGIETQIRELQEQQQASRKALRDLEVVPSLSRPRSARAKAPHRAMLVGRAHEPGTVEVMLPRSVCAKPTVLAADISEDAASVERVSPWLRGWGEARARMIRSSGHDAEYVEFMLSHLRERFRIAPPPRRRRRRPSGARTRTYDLFTGAAAVRESMQLEGMTEALFGGTRDIPIESVGPLELKDHPFEKMRGGRGFKGSDLAKLCPRDAIFARVRSFKELFRVQDLTDRWGGSLLSTVKVSSKEFDTFGRYKRRLGLDHDLVAGVLGSAVVGELAIVVADPLFTEGTGLAAIVAPRKGREAALRSMFNTLHWAGSMTAKGARKSRLDIEGVPVSLLETPDRSLRSYGCELAGRHVFSNSPGLLGRIIRASKDEKKSLFAASDYRYYRSLFPLDDDESGFLFLSQDWFRKITGPAWRIARGRRAGAGFIMQNARFAWQSALGEGAASADLASLVGTGLVPENAAASLRLALDPGTGRVSCPEYGALGHLNPVDDLLPQNVSREEARLYRGFKEEYSRFWRKYIDPVGIRLRMSDEELTLDTLVLPLADNSIYDGLKEASGLEIKEPGRSPPLPADALGAVAFHAAPMKGAEAFLGDGALKVPGTEVSLDPAWFGNTVAMGVADGDMLFTASSGADELLGTFGWGRGQMEGFMIAGVISAMLLPTFAAVEVRDAASIERFLDSVWAELKRRPKERFDPRVLTYATPEEPRIHTVTVTFEVVDFRVHYAFAGDWLLAATKPGLLKRCIAAAEAGRGAPFEDNGRLVIRPGAFDRAASALGIAWQERIAGACQSGLASLGRAADAGRLDDAEGFLGYRVLCPEGGELTSAGGEVRCSIHGAPEERLQPLKPPKEAAAVQLINETDEISVSFRFTEDGLRSRVRMRFAPREE